MAGLWVARSNLNLQHNIMPGYVQAQASSNTLGVLHYEDYGTRSASAYEVATCHPPTHQPFRCNNATGRCENVTVGTPGALPTQQECAATCVPPPPPPLAQNPCIRFGHAIPVGNRVDVEIVQDGDESITHTWTDYKFTQFSDWVNVFRYDSN